MMKHDSVRPLRSIPPIRRILSALSIVISLGLALAAFGSPATSAWTYQGQLRRSGAAYNGTCNFQFSLWDAASGGTQKGGTQSINSVSVANGLFTVALDFRELSSGGYPGFTGDALWLGTSVQCSGDGGFTPLDPRQPITATPYALSLVPGASIIGPGLATPIGPVGTLNVRNTGTEGYAVYGQSAGGASSAGVLGTNTNGPGVWGRSTFDSPAIYGESYNNASGNGIAGKFDGAVRIRGGNLVYNTLVVTNPDPLDTSTAIEGLGSIGVYGFSATAKYGSGVYGRANGQNSAGVYGENAQSAAIWGHSNGVGPAIFGETLGSGYAGRFKGSVLVEGNLIVAGTLTKNAGAFRIDHPLDPEHKFLSHSFVESPDMKNIYDGNVTTDATGSAIVTLPNYFEALNRDFRYQLTVLGQFAQAIISRKIDGNSFEIRTDKPGVEVSWQVTGIRQDAYAQAHPIVVEEPKLAEEQGMYLFPAGFGAGEDKGIGHLNRPASMPGAGPTDQPSK